METRDVIEDMNITDLKYDCDGPQNKHETKNIECICPGYNTVLEELVSFAKLVDSSAAPTGVLLSGCAGVGKSRMVCLCCFYWNHIHINNSPLSLYLNEWLL
jgi:DNA replication protein DnaC